MPAMLIAMSRPSGTSAQPSTMIRTGKIRDAGQDRELEGEDKPEGDEYAEEKARGRFQDLRLAHEKDAPREGEQQCRRTVLPGGEVPDDRADRHGQDQRCEVERRAEIVDAPNRLRTGRDSLEAWRQPPTGFDGA